MKRSLLGAVSALAFVLAGCQTGTLPDPNDPQATGVLKLDVLQHNIKGASDALLERRVKGEITDVQFRQYMADYVKGLLTQMHLEKVPQSQAWQYAEVFRTAESWPEAEKLLRVAVATAKNDDRFVNDSLRLAQSLCNLNRVGEAIPIARATFRAKPPDKAPILTAVLLEIVPAGRGKGHDPELAQLLIDSIHQSEMVVVDPKSDAGKIYLMARPHHQRNAWALAVDLYEASGNHALAEKTRTEAVKQLGNTAVL